jgi:chromosome segregation ATPase
MQLEVESQASGGLRLLKDLPDIAMCLLEGENGVGKTATIQLLELMCGSVPREFALRPSLWISLRERIGATRVRLTAVRGAKTIEFLFTPKSWPDTPTVDDRLGHTLIDGREGTTQSIGAVLSVVRISGNEDLEQTLQRRVDYMIQELRDYGVRLQSGSDAVRETIAEILRVLSRADPSAFEADLEEVESASAAVENLREKVTESETRLRILLDALEAQRRLDSVGKEAGALQLERKTLLDEIDTLNTHLSDAESKAKEADEQYAKQGGAEKRLADAEQLLRTRARRLSNGELRLRAAIRALGLDSNDLNVDSALREELAKATTTLGVLNAASSTLDKSASVRSFMTELQRSISSAAEISGETIADLNGGPVTVDDLRHGIETRRKEIEAQPTSDAPSDLAQETLRVRRRIAALRGALDQFSTVKRDRQLVLDAQKAVEASGKGAERASKAAKRSHEANVEYGAAQTKLEAAMDRLSAIQGQMGVFGNISEEDALRDIHLASKEFNSPVDDLNALEDETRASDANVRSQLEIAKETVAASRKSLDARRAELELSVGSLINDPDIAWLTQAAPTLLSGLRSTDEDIRFGALRLAFETLKGLEAEFDESADLVAGLQGIAEEYFEPARTTLTEFELNFKPTFESVVSQNLLGVLNRPALRTKLFGDGEVTAIDPGSRTMTITTSDSAVTVRPLEAFSTGEQALAFTQARIADLPAPTTPNRLLVLDEFGAFVSAERFPDLVDFLKDIREEADQIVVVLPLQVDYQKELPQTTGELRERYTARVDALAGRGYFTEELT